METILNRTYENAMEKAEECNKLFDAIYYVIREKGTDPCGNVYGVISEVDFLEDCPGSDEYILTETVGAPAPCLVCGEPGCQTNSAKTGRRLERRSPISTRG